MKTKYLTRARLIAVNKKAQKAGNNYIDPEFVKLLPKRFKFPVIAALPFPLTMGWVRCWVTIGVDDTIVKANIKSLLVDLQRDDFDNLPTVQA